MTSKHPRPAKDRSSGSLLKVDWDKVLEERGIANPHADKLDQHGNPVISKGGPSHLPPKPANHKSHIRQKKV
jgi:hypothetical protein